MTPSTRKQPRSLAPSASTQHATQILAIAPRLLVEMRAAYSLPSACLSLLYACRAIQVDKAGYYSIDEALRLCGLQQRAGRRYYKKLEAAGYVRRVGGDTTHRLQNWQLTEEGWVLVGDATQRAASQLSPLLNRNVE